MVKRDHLPEKDDFDVVDNLSCSHFPFTYHYKLIKRFQLFPVLHGMASHTRTTLHHLPRMSNGGYPLFIKEQFYLSTTAQGFFRKCLPGLILHSHVL